MHQFRYAMPNSIEALLSMLANQHGPVKPMAGGTDLIVQMRSGALAPDVVVDVKQVPELNSLLWSDQGLAIGAAVSCRTICENDQVASAYPALIDSASLIGGIQIQGRASIGGNLCNASPSADSVPTLIVLDAVADIQSSSHARKLQVENFCTGPGINALAPDEVLVSLKLPPQPDNSGAYFLRFTPRNEMDIAVANAAAFVVLSADCKHFISARIAIGAVGPTPILVREAAEFLQGKPVSSAPVNAAAGIARQAASPINDMRGNVRQRKHLVEVLVTRALRGAIKRAGGLYE